MSLPRPTSQENLLQGVTQLVNALETVADPPRARVYNSANITITTATTTALTFDSERFDSATIHDVSSNPSRLTCHSPGVYLISAHVEWAANSVGVRTLSIRANGGTVIASQEINANATGTQRHSLSTVYLLAPGEYVEVLVTQNSGGNLAVNAAADYSPEFGMVWLGPTP